MNIEPTNAAFLSIVPPTLLSLPSESKKSYLLNTDPSVVKVFILLRTLRP